MPSIRNAEVCCSVVAYFTSLCVLSVEPLSTRFWVVKKYAAVLPDEVDLSLHAEVEVIDMNLSGWWLVR